MGSIEPAEKKDTADTPRSLWDRVESQLRPPEVFTIRRIIGESVLDRNDGLWREVDALEDILREAQDQNDRRSTRLAARPVMSPGLERTFLEAHLRLLLGKLGVSNADRTTKEGSWPATPGNDGHETGGGDEAATAAQPRSRTGRDDDTWRRGIHSARSCCVPAKGLPEDPPPSRERHRPGRKQTSSSAPTTPWVPLETQEDRAVYDFLSASSANGADGRDGCNRSSAGNGPEDGTFGAGGSGSRPGTSRRPGSSRSARSAPECLESGRSLTVATIDTALGELRAAFDEEAENLMGEVTDLTDLLEHEATRKATAERRSRQSMSTVGKSNNDIDDDDGGDTDNTGGPAWNGGPIPSSELRRYGKKLEEAVRSQEHAADVLERLALPRRRSPGEPTGSEAAADGRKGRGRRGDGAAAVAQAPRSNGKADIGRRNVRDPLTPSPPCFKGVPDPAGSTSLNRRGPEGRRRGSNRRASSGGDGVSGSGRSSDGLPRGEGDNFASADVGVPGAAVGAREGRWRGEQQGQGRGALLAVRLHGAVRVSREEDALDDERFWS